MLTLVVCFFAALPAQNANAQITLVGERVQKVHALPGEQYTGSVMIHNEADHALTIRVYQDEITALTSFDRGDEIVTISRSNADWVSHTSEKMTIQSGEVAELAYQVVVPLRLDTEPPSGTYWSSLTVDVIAMGSTAEARRPYSRHNLTDIATQIKGTGDASLAINSLHVMGDPVEKKLQAAMVNTGDLIVKPDVWFELYNASGSLETRVAVKSEWIYPGALNRVVAEMPELVPGIYEAHVVVDAGEDRIFGKSYTLDLTGIGTVAQTGWSGMQF